MFKKIALIATLIFALCVSLYMTSDQAISAQDLERIEFESNGSTLVGRVDFPQGEGPFPAVAIVHGSGLVTRFAAGFVASVLNSNGIAVLRYDKRGVGDSEGSYANIGPGNSEFMFDLLSDDAIAAVEYLQSLDNIKSDQVGLYGASQAGWIIPLAASKSESIAFAAIVVGPTVTVGEEIFYSNLTGEVAGSLTEERLDEISAQLADYTGPHGFDPRPSIEAMKQPGLWVLGGLDASIPTRETIIILEEIRDEFEKDITIHLFPTGTHSMRDANTGESLPFMTEHVVPWIEEQLEKIDARN